MAESNPNPTAGYDIEQTEGAQAVLFNATRHADELLRLEGLPPYKCSGCKEFGANIGYKCKHNDSSSSCQDFTLHEICASFPDALQHPFRSDVTLEFRPKWLRGDRCNACWDVVKGYVFESDTHNLRFHPLCIGLPTLLDFGGHANHKLKLVMGDLKGKPYTCSACHSHIDSANLKYGCEQVECNVHVHVSCVKKEMVGLSNYGTHTVVPVGRGRSASVTNRIVKCCCRPALVKVIVKPFVNWFAKGFVKCCCNCVHSVLDDDS